MSLLIELKVYIIFFIYIDSIGFRKKSSHALKIKTDTLDFRYGELACLSKLCTL